jgi:iron complex outermembrane receptor protein
MTRKTVVLAASLLVAAPALPVADSLASAGADNNGSDQTQRTSPDEEHQLQEVIVTGERVRSLEQFTPTGSRLNLSAKDTPATLDVIDSTTINTRGFLLVEQAAATMPGVTFGGPPGDMQDFHIRGFSDTQITVLHNGIYVGPSDMVNRPQNTFNIAQVEVLKGPASVLYGQGAIGGAINIVNTAPTFGAPSVNFYGAMGSFGTTAIGAGGSATIADNLAFRLDASRTSTSGYVNNSPGDSTDVTLTAIWKVNANLDLQFALDVLTDDPQAYWGTPLVSNAFATQPLNGVVSTANGYTLDERMRFINYNVGDSYIHSSQYWPQLLLKWRPNDFVTVENYSYYFKANRKWIDAETYTFDPATNQIDRDRFFVFHNQELIGNQSSVSLVYPLFGLKNRFVAGLDYSYLDFKRDRGFPNGDSVDPLNPNPGLFGPLVEFHSPTHWHDTALFFEDILNLTERLKMITGAREDYLSLERKDFGPDGSFDAVDSFSRTFRPFTYRVGFVYDVNSYVTPYLSYTTGQDPVGDNIFEADASAGNFKLGRSWQIEVGVKADAPENRASMTAAVFDIRRRNVLLSINPILAVPNGSESSKGFEAIGDVKLNKNVTINANVAYTNAKYQQFTYVDSNNALIDASGNPIPNAPKWVANAWASYTSVAALPVDVGFGITYVDSRSGNTANTIQLDSYTTLNAYVTYRALRNVAVSLRGDNLTDKAYATAALINYPNQVFLGRPRYFQADVTVRY